LPYVNSVEKVSVKTGFNGTVTNKGCCAVALNLGTTSFLFCCAHLEAHAHNVAARNDGWKRIESELCKKLSKCKGKTLKGAIASDFFDRVVFMGDLNYRVAGEYKLVCEAIARNDMDGLLSLDQLHQVLFTFKMKCDVFNTAHQRFPHIASCRKWRKKWCLMVTRSIQSIFPPLTSLISTQMTMTQAKKPELRVGQIEFSTSTTQNWPGIVCTTPVFRPLKVLTIDRSVQSSPRLESV
jgi:hypothetical protein